jgi:hypothetical protein
LTNRVPAVVDIAGQTVKRPTSSVGGANPFPITRASNDPVLKELARLGVSTSQPPASVKRRGQVTLLSDSQRQKLAEQEGQELYNRLSKIVLGKGWQSLPDDARRKQITKFRRQIEESRQARITKLVKE